MKLINIFLHFVLCISFVSYAMEAPERELPHDLEQTDVNSDSYLSDEESGPLVRKRDLDLTELLEKLKQKVASKEIHVFKVGTTIPDLTPLANHDYILCRTTTVKFNKVNLVPSRLLIFAHKLDFFLNDPIIKQRKEANPERVNAYLTWFIETDYRMKLRNQIN